MKSDQMVQACCGAVSCCNRVSLGCSGVLSKSLLVKHAFVKVAALVMGQLLSFNLKLLQVASNVDFLEGCIKVTRQVFLFFTLLVSQAILDQVDLGVALN